MIGSLPRLWVNSTLIWRRHSTSTMSWVSSPLINLLLDFNYYQHLSLPNIKLRCCPSWSLQRKQKTFSNFLIQIWCKLKLINKKMKKKIVILIIIIHYKAKIMRNKKKAIRIQILIVMMHNLYRMILLELPMSQVENPSHLPCIKLNSHLSPLIYHRIKWEECWVIHKSQLTEIFNKSKIKMGRMIHPSFEDKTHFLNLFRSRWHKFFWVLICLFLWVVNLELRFLLLPSWG